MADMPTASQIATNTRNWQRWLNSAKNPRTTRPLVVDGKWGKSTYQAYVAWHDWFNITPAPAQGAFGPYFGKQPLALVWQDIERKPTQPGPPRQPDPLPPPDKPPIWKEPWFWFTAAAAFVLISAFRSKKKR